MAVFKPFKALRYAETSGNIKELVCPPYDIISDEERKNFLKTNPYNVIRLELPREGEDVYCFAAKTLNDFEEGGILKQDTEDCFYIYEEDFEVDGQNYKLKGIIGRTKLTNFEEGVVIPHENTLSAAKEDRFNLMMATSCNFSQVYCLFEDGDKKISEKIDLASNGEPIHCFTDNEGVTHKLWKTTDTTEITKLFSDKALYIADGHHRYETGLRYRDTMRKQGTGEDSASEYIMMMLVPAECDGLVVFPTHRIVHSLESFDMKDLLSKCSEYFYVGEVTSAESLERNLKKEYENGNISFGFYCEERFFLLTLKDPTSLIELLPNLHPTLRSLDVSVLHSLVLEEILGIDKENLAKQINLKYTRDVSEAIEKTNSGANCAFILNPTRVSQIIEVGSAGQKMPQKSTYFYPKLITGLVMNKIK